MTNDFSYGELTAYTRGKESHRIIERQANWVVYENSAPLALVLGPEKNAQDIVRALEVYFDV